MKSLGHPMALFKVLLPSLLMSCQAENGELWLQVVAIMRELFVDALWATRKNGKASLTVLFISLYSLLLLAPFCICWNISKLKKVTLG